MTTWQEPTGRERAIEALMDRDKDGDFFRYSKVVEEAVPAALNSRPNRITKAALIEQAFCLRSNVIETSAKHLLTFDEAEEQKKSARKLAVPAVILDSKRKIWKHQATIRSAKTTGDDSITLPSAFYTTVEKVLRSKKDSDKGDLLKEFEAYTAKHTLLEPKDSGEEPSGENAMSSCEGLVTNLTKLIDAQEDNEIFSGIWIAILSILTLDQAKPSTEELDASSNSHGSSASLAEAGNEPPRESFLQVGALLPFCRVEYNQDNQDEKSDGPNIESIGTLDPELLDYFARAAGVYEERLEMIAARKSTLDLAKETDAAHDRTNESENGGTIAVETNPAPPKCLLSKTKQKLE